jgi:hypothetical protein
MDFIAFAEQEFGEIGPILAGDTSYESLLAGAFAHCGSASLPARDWGGDQMKSAEHQRSGRGQMARVKMTTRRRRRRRRRRRGRRKKERRRRRFKKEDGYLERGDCVGKCPRSEECRLKSPTRQF